MARARSKDPQHPAVARTEMTLAYLRGADKDVVRSGQTALASDPDDIYGHYLVGHALAAQGQVREAERFLGSAARLDPSEHAITDAARSARLLTHWLLAPLWPLKRFGPVKVWLAAMAIMLLLYQVGSEPLLAVFALVYVVFVIYSWVVPRLLRRWLQHRHRRFMQ